uniref:Wax synthase domain-containing protein n=1 Tax=Rhizophagus irregularis (strain DAOM 181602 / DAOM 197198 / MUCL 43194) TaxID=747089 RepID=U9UTP1_RHIID
MHPLTKKDSYSLYILTTTLFVYVINFAITNPTILTKEFPPKLPTTVFLSLYFIPKLLFIILSLEPIKTRKRCYTLIVLLFLYLIIPLSYRLKYHPGIMTNVIVFTGIYSFKMSLFIKYNRKYLPDTKINQQKEFTPYILTLNSWRHDSDIESKTEIEEPTMKQVDEKTKSRVLVFIWKLMIYEAVLYLFANFPQKVPERAYQIRMIEYFTKGIPIFTFTAASLFHYVSFFIFFFLYLSFHYDIIVLFSLLALRCMITSQSSTPEKHILVKSGLLTPIQFSLLKNYFITYTFNTKHCFDNPWISKNPREVWSSRWHTMFAETLKELGYLPFRNLCISLGITSRKFCNAMGVLGAFFISSLLHEYYILGMFNMITENTRACF